MPNGLGGVVAQHLLPDLPDRLGVAVSGGGDSVALLHLLHDFLQNHGVALCAVTVNHALRPEATKEAQRVAGLCADLGVPHEIMNWRDWDGRGNLQNAARRARYELIASWAGQNDLRHVALGHTLDDQAETVLMRLARGSGVDGLTAMTPRRVADGITWMRPLLGVSRETLRQHLRDRGVGWCDDPSNDDTRFERIRLRQALKILQPLGIDPAALAQVAENMGRAREALDGQAVSAAREIVTIEAGAVRIDWCGFEALPAEIARRIILSALKWIGGASYAPRRKSVLRLIAAIREGRNGTLDGCRLRRAQAALWICREYRPVRDMICKPSEIWDRRWHVTAALHDDGLHVAALGDQGLRQVPEWRATGYPRDVLLVTPAVWKRDALVAAPLAGATHGWHAIPTKDKKALFDTLLSH